MSEKLVESEVASNPLAPSRGRVLGAIGLVELALLCLRVLALAALAMPLLLAAAIAWRMAPSAFLPQNTVLESAPPAMIP
jgi:hypothetical protein